MSRQPIAKRKLVCNQCGRLICVRSTDGRPMKHQSLIGFICSGYAGPIRDRSSDA